MKENQMKVKRENVASSRLRRIKLRRFDIGYALVRELIVDVDIQALIYEREDDTQ